MRTNTNVLEGIIRRNAYSSQHGVFVVANAELPDFPVIYVSDKFSNKLGYTRADLIGEPITLDFMGNKDVTQMLSQFLVNISRTSAKLLPQETSQISNISIRIN
ncbi:unnamed protein product [Oikopleura dioica]|uniref:PAS domain-containing protein n=1 Tax=Oikopleura dioica TaxID=34765 RepID=E4WRS3_OIKDI|nr:unnamed protein product [Oikopleura dioica]CBY33007.1 unnamed protein product [Oikopleura dioica]